MRFDYVIIGSGVAGLTAAAYLSGKGFSVAVLEKGPRPGPTLAGFVREGLRFDTGLHLTGGLGHGEILRSYLKMLGVDKDLEPVFLRQDAAEQILFSHDAAHIPPLSLPTGFAAFGAALRERFSQQTGAVDGYIAALRQALDASAFLNPHQDAPDFMHGDVAFSDTSLNAVLDGLTADPLLRMVFFLRCSLHGARPEEALFHNHALVDGSLRETLGTFKGGGYALIKALVRKIKANGGALRMNCPAQEIVCENGELRGVRTPEGLFETTRCIYTGHPALLPGLVPQDAFRAVYKKRLLNLPETMSCCMLFAVVDPAARDGGESGEKGRAFSGGPEGPEGPVCEDDTTFYLCSSTDPDVLFNGDDPERNLIFVSLAPGKGGKQALTAIAPCSFERFAPFAGAAPGCPNNPRPAAYHQAKSALIEIMKQRILVALPSLKVRLRVVDGATPLTLAEYTHNPRGGTYGVRQTVDNLPLLPRTRLAGLFLAGQSVLLPGVLGSMVSALVACGLSTDWAALQKELRQWHVHE